MNLKWMFIISIIDKSKNHTLMDPAITLETSFAKPKKDLVTYGQNICWSLVIKSQYSIILGIHNKQPISHPDDNMELLFSSNMAQETKLPSGTISTFISRYCRVHFGKACLKR